MNFKMNKAMALVTVLIVTFLLFSLAGAFLLLTTNERILNERYYENLIALGLAEAGVDYAVWEINFGGELEDWIGDNPKMFSMNNFEDADGNVYGDINISVYGPGEDEVTIISEGVLSSFTGPVVRSRVRVLLRRHRLFNGAIIAIRKIEVGGTSDIDSYDSSLGLYGGSNVGENGDLVTNYHGEPAVSIYGHADVRGDAVTGPDGTVSITGSAKLSGDINDDADIFMPPVIVPSSLKNLPSGGNLSLNQKNDSLELEAGNYKFSSLRLGGQATLTLNGEKGDVNIYLTGNPSVTTIAQSQIIVTNGKANIYFDGDLSIGGQGILNLGGDPSDFTLLGTESASDVSLAGIGKFYGTVYAPSSDYKISGNTDIYGAIAANNVSTIGTEGIHFDEELLNDGPAIGYDPYAWQEK